MNKKESYQELLKDPKWIKKRNEILARDKNTCQICGAQDKYLHVHHRYYVQGWKPWEYPSDILITLCEDCHKGAHDGTLCNVKIGDTFVREHGDFENICVVYYTNSSSMTVKLIEYDNGAGYDTLYNDEISFKELNTKYYQIDLAKGVKHLYEFDKWFNNVVKESRKKTCFFRSSVPIILRNNEALNDIIENYRDYE